MILDKTYKINDLIALSETLDEETIIINLENGTYYSMNSSSTLIWDKIAKNYSTSEIIQYFASRYNENFELIEKSVNNMIEFLKNDNLILPTDHNAVAEAEDCKLPKETFIIPLIEKYEDMQEMLLADPIHDVQEQGWPMLKQAKN